MFPALKIAGVEASKFRQRPARRGRGDRRPDPRVGRPARAGRARLPAPGDLHVRDAPAARHAAARGRCGVRLPRRPAANPPAWMQQYALEWLWRLGLEPKRLWRRYVLLNPAYLARLAAQKPGCGRRRRRRRPPNRSRPSRSERHPPARPDRRAGLSRLTVCRSRCRAAGGRCRGLAASPPETPADLPRSSPCRPPMHRCGLAPDTRTHVTPATGGIVPFAHWDEVAA